MKTFLYSHGGSGNHGCEALARTTAQILGNDVYKLFSLEPDEDKKYGIDKILQVENARNYEKNKFKLAIAAAQIKFNNNNYYSEYLDISNMLHEKADVAVSIGGDNYCYDGFGQFCFKNKLLNEHGFKTVLWGCSVESDMINDEMRRDLARYSFITARESITYEAVKKLNKNTYLCADPAFTLQPVETELPQELKGKKIAGINVSPMILNCKADKSMTIKNIKKMIKYIIEETDYYIMLVPHVVWSQSDDRVVLKKIKESFADNPRVVLIEDCGCRELKYLISKCEIFIGARTHSTIAAYSSCVPTIVLGYSVKSKGIAKDIFGSYEHYVLPVQELENECDLLREFKYIDENKEIIRKHLNAVMPAYIESAYKAGDYFREVLGK